MYVSACTGSIGSNEDDILVAAFSKQLKIKNAAKPYRWFDKAPTHEDFNRQV